MVRERLKRALAEGDDPYAFVDLDAATKLGGGVPLMGAALALVTLPLLAPTGTLALTVALGYITASLIAGAYLVRRSRPVKPALLLSGVYANLLGLMAYRAAAGEGAPIEAIAAIVAAFAAMIHPLRRTLVVLAFAAVVPATPLIYEAQTSVLAARAVTQLLLVTGIGILVCLLMTRVREQRRKAAETAELARIDALTGVGNRRALEEALPIAVSFTRRHNQPLSMLVADMDDFKAINDTFGHQVGDDMLRAATRSMNAGLRLSDPCFRWGGDEFVALLPDADLAEAEEIAARVRSTVAAACQTPDGRPLQVTIGAAELNDHQSGDDLMAVADAQLLARKAARRVGRLRVTPAAVA